MNPLGLDRFSGEEKVHIELLHLLKELKAPLKAFSGILNWAAKANGQGHIFHPDCQPSCRRVVHNLYCRYNMKGLIPKEKLFYLPYSRRTVPMIYFDAREVFASLLSCPLLNRDKNYLFDSLEKDPFIGPPKSSIIGDINTGQCYRKTHEALVKNPDVNMILPTIVAMDKTQVDTYGRLQMEPLTISHGLMKHNVRSKHTAMRILGYVCHSSPAHQTKMKGGVPDIGHTQVCHGQRIYSTRCTFRLSSSSKFRDTLTSNTTDSSGIFITTRECIQWCCTPSFPSLLGISRDTIASVGITLPDLKKSSSFAVFANAPHIYQGTQRQSLTTGNQQP